MVEPALPTAPETPFAPLPLRPRGAMELLDTSVKLYRQYFGVLLGWSALITAISVVVSLLPGGGIVSFLLSPMEFGVAACCLAAAVRGQRVTFKQCWDFTQPRYGSLLLMSFLCGLILVLLVIPAAIIIGVGIGLGGAALGSASLLIGLGVVMIIVLLVLGSYGTIWYYMVATVVCFEEDKRNTSSMGHAYQLLKGQWARILGITLLLGLIYLILVSIIGAVVWFALSGSEVIAGLSSSSSPTKAISGLTNIALSWALLSSLVSMLLTPLLHLCVGMSYLDIRTRKEALDLQWAAHVAAPVAPSPYGNPAFLNAPGERGYQNTGQGYAPQGYNPQGYAPPGYPPQQNYPPANYPQQGYPPQNYAQQGYPPQNQPAVGYPPQPYPQQIPLGSVPPTASPQIPPPQYGPPSAGMTQQLPSTPDPLQMPMVPPVMSQSTISAPALETPALETPANAPTTISAIETASASASSPPSPFTMAQPPSSPMLEASSPSAGTNIAALDNGGVTPPMNTPEAMPPSSAFDFAPLPTNDFLMSQGGGSALPTQISGQPLTDTAPTETSLSATPTAQAGTETVTCPQCGAISPRGQQFCMTCGSSLPTS